MTSRYCCLLFWTFYVTSVTLAQISNELDVDVDSIKKQIGDEFPNFNMSSIDESQIPSMDEMDVILRNKCDSTGGNGTYDQVKGSKDVLLECVSNFVNVTELREEVEEAKKTGSMDEVFGKYCAKYPDLSKCTDEFIQSAVPCMKDEEMTSINKTLGIVQQLKDFACHKNGDRIAMFVAEGGVECISSQQEALKQCLNNTLASKTLKGVTIDTPLLMFDTDDCSEFMALRKCVGDALGKCDETTPANLVDAFFKYLKKILPCSIDAAATAGKSTKSDGSFKTYPLASLVLIFSIILVKFT